MKTCLVVVRLFILVVLVAFAGVTDAQTIISFDSSPDNTMVMKIQDPKLSKKPDKLILIFDSATLTCEFSDEGIIALHTTQQISGNSVMTSSYSYTIPGKFEIVEKSWCKMTNEKVIDEEIKEEPISFEDWMLRPDEWL